MNAIELFLADGRPAGVWYCEKCRVVHTDMESAERCCQPRICDVCNEPVLEKNRIMRHIKCQHAQNELRNRERLEKAETIEGYTDWVYSDEVIGHRDGYFESADDLVEHCEDEGIDVPEFALCCTRNGFVMDEGNAIEDAERRIGIEQCEDYERSYSGLKEFREACERFTAQNQDVCTWEVDYKRKVRVRDAGI